MNILKVGIKVGIIIFAFFIVDVAVTLGLFFGIIFLALTFFIPYAIIKLRTKKNNKPGSKGKIQQLHIF